jgi:hypothetical protein
LVADSIGAALLIVLDRLDPAERLAFVLHDMFAVSFDEIATILGSGWPCSWWNISPISLNSWS